MVCPYCESRGSGKFCSYRSVATNDSLAAEWHEDNPSPSQNALGNDDKHKWRRSISDCGHVWEARPSDRSISGNNCPECNGKSKGKGKGKHISLAEGRPDLLAEWYVDRNACPATGITCGSGRLAWWVCKKCGGAWQSKVYSRATRGCGCPRCRELDRLQPRNVLRTKELP
jgi:hypothetical protein